jgi:hypothetical protein
MLWKTLFRGCPCVKVPPFYFSILLNSEAWTNLTDKDIRGLEQSDEILLSKILDSEPNASNTFKYLQLGIAPLRFEIMMRTSPNLSTDWEA